MPRAELPELRLFFVKGWQLPSQVRYTRGAKREAGAWLSFLHIPDCFTVHTADWRCLLPSQLSCKRLTGPSLVPVTQLVTPFLSLLPPFSCMGLLASVGLLVGANLHSRIRASRR